MLLNGLKQFFDDALKKSEDERYFVRELGDKFELNEVPDIVKQAYLNYKVDVENLEFGSVKLYKIFVDIISFYAVHSIEDKETSHLEVYSQAGEQMACARYDGQLMDLSNQETVFKD